MDRLCYLVMYVDVLMPYQCLIEGMKNYLHSVEARLHGRPLLAMDKAECWVSGVDLKFVETP